MEIFACFTYLVQNHDRAPPQHCSRQPDELSLSLAEVATTGVDLRVETPLLLAAVVADLGQDGFTCRVGVLVEGIEILA